MMWSQRPGFSLLEVMLATTVLLGSVIVLSHIAFVGTAHMDSAQQYAAAQLVCQARMNEMLAAALPIEEVSNQPIPELPGWGMTVKVKSASQSGLLALQVTAAEQPAEMGLEGSFQASGEVANESQQVVGAGKQFTLVRWIAEPQGSETSSSTPSTALSTPVDLPMEPSLFNDSASPEKPLLPDAIPMPEEPSMLDEPMPNL